jgi:diguanylate cyclase (GGDEF)-like protein/PAS domain S-box-containing protein
MSFFTKCVRAAVKRLERIGSFRSRRAAKDGEVRRPQRESHAAEQATYESERRFRILVQNTSDIITLIDADGTVHYESSALERVMGYRPEDQVGTNAFDWVHLDDMDRALSIFAEVLSTPGVHPPVEFRAPHKDGSWRYLEHTVNNLLDDPEVGAIVVTSRDVTKRKELEEQLRHQAFHDSLTDLPNRALFMDRLEHALARTRRGAHSVAVLFMDLDNFKLVNDSLGHEVGNELLAGVARRLKACSRPEDTMARLGGDEFAVLLEDVTDEGEATHTAQLIAEKLRTPFLLGEQEVFAVLSIGIALDAATQPEAQDLLRLAEMAMYESKNSGEVCCLASDLGTTGQALKRLELESDLRRAIERRGFRVCYQPEVLLDSGRPVGMEALVRWAHPQRGLLLASEFVPVAEETGLISPIGLWVLEAACRQAREWQEQHPSIPPLTVWVNLSAKQFREPELVNEVARALQKSGLPSSGLGLEITESVVMEDTPATIMTFRELAGLGVRLAIDDFGTGYSSLSALHRFPVEVLKIDRSFIEGLKTGPEDGVILSAILDLARTLGMKAIAEGVETAEQLARLREMGCKMAQGNYFSEPLLGEAASALLAARFPFESRLPRSR